MKQDIKTLWKTLAQAKKNTAANHMQLCILRAMQSKGEDKVAIAKHFIRKSFTPVTRTIKIANGRTPFDIFNRWDVNASITSISYDWATKKSIIGYRNLLGIPANEVLDDEEIEQYGEILEKLPPRVLVRRYSYFFTRQDTFEEYQLVQTAHAALELGAKLAPEQVKDLHFTCCGVSDLEELENVERVLQSMKIEYIVFREPDIGNQKTSIGVYPLEEHRRGLLRNYNLLRFQSVKLLPVALELIDELMES